MKLLIGFLAAALLQSPSPRFAWTTVKDSTISVYAGDLRALRLPAMPQPHNAKFRLEISADSAVSFGFASTDSFDEAVSGLKFASQVDFSGMSCAATGTIKDSTECEFSTDEPNTFALRDDRSGGSLILAALGLLTRSGAAIDRTTKPNNVHILISQWRCVANCPQ